MKIKTGLDVRVTAEDNGLRVVNYKKNHIKIFPPDDWNKDEVEYLIVPKSCLCPTALFYVAKWFARVGIVLSLVLAIIHQSSILAVIHQLVR